MGKSQVEILLLLGLCIPHGGLVYAQSPNSKAIEQLKTFLHQLFLLFGNDLSCISYFDAYFVVIFKKILFFSQ
jgi:hypothetical protein